MNQPHSTAGPSGVEMSQIWRGREAVRIANGTLACTLLRQGGTIADVRLCELEASTNLVWESPWFGPAGAPSDEDLASRYGDVDSGRYLQHYTGHTLCLDGFGPASPEDFKLGAGLHGEAIQREWRGRGGDKELLLEASLPIAGLEVTRRFEMLPGEAVLRVRESVRNVGAIVRNIHWVQHATVGPPAFAAGSRVVTSANEGLTWPLDYEGSNALATDAQFSWPMAPGASNHSVDLATLFATERSGFVAAVKQPADRTCGFVAAHDPETGLMLAYIFRADIFPWLTLWEENRCRRSSPWKGAVQARGLEFGTTPFPLGNDMVDAHGPVLGAPTSYALAAGATVTGPWLIAAARLPRSFTQIDDLCVEDDALAISCGADRFVIPAAGVSHFLLAEGARK